MKKIDKEEPIRVNLHKAFISAKLAVTLLIICMVISYNSLLLAIAEKNIYAIVLYSSLLCFQVFVWIWNVFL